MGKFKVVVSDKFCNQLELVANCASREEAELEKQKCKKSGKYPDGVLHVLPCATCPPDLDEHG